MYHDFYKLTGRPFQLTPDPRFLFPSAGHRRALSYLLYGLEQKEGFVVITGAVGSGKTLLVQTLFKELRGRNMATASLAAANLTSDTLIALVASAFELPFEGRDKVSMLVDLRHLLSHQPEYRDGALLVIDEAQALSAEALEELRILSNLEQNGRALLQIFLIGQPELRQVLLQDSMEQMRQRVIASHQLEPLSAEETRDYILHRLKSVGWNDDPALSADIFQVVYRWSEGIPRRVNLFMDRTLLFGYLEELHLIDGGSITTVIKEMNAEISGAHAGPRQRTPKPSAGTPGPSGREKMLEKRLAALEQKIDGILQAGFADTEGRTGDAVAPLRQAGDKQ